MDFSTSDDLKNAFKTAARTNLLLSSDCSVPEYVLPDDIETMHFVINELMPQIKDLRSRRIVWLRSQGLCWKSVAKDVRLSESQVQRIFKREISGFRKT